MSETERGERTALESDEENSLAQVSDQDFIHGTADWDGPDYATVRIPSAADRPKWEWSYEERQAFLFEKLREYGTPGNLPKSQTEYGEEFGVAQQQISKDIERVRRYIAAHAGDRAVSKAAMLANRAVEELAEEDPKKAMDTWLDYCEFLFDTGAMDRAPDKKQVQTYNVNESVDEGLSDDEREKFDQFVDMMTGDRQSEPDEPIDVEAEEVDDE